MIRPLHKQLAASIHADNRRAGWWTDLETGQDKDRNFGEMLALVHSELSEAFEGIAYKLFDTHLPRHPMYQVEIADACIRVYDMIGGCFPNLPASIEFALDFPIGFITIEQRLIYLHFLLSSALEFYRKSDFGRSCMYLYHFLDGCFELAEEEQFDLIMILEEKREYNRNRADHKIENRKLSDGKKI